MPLRKNKGRRSMTNGAAWNHHYRSRFRRSREEKLAGREGFEPSIPDPKSGALPLGDRPLPNFFPKETHPTPGKISSSPSQRSSAAPSRKHFLVFHDDFFLDHSTGFIINRMGDVLIGAILMLFTRHGNKESSRSLNNL